MFRPFAKSGGWYIGGGAGFMIDEYRVDDWSRPGRSFAADLTAGLNIFDSFDISYTLRTNFTLASNKLAFGYTYRFK
jgi:hypothetical protein